MPVYDFRMDKNDCKALAEWDSETVELSVGLQHRVILNTMHGTIIIDVRKSDVNAFVSGLHGRKDIKLLPAD